MEFKDLEVGMSLAPEGKGYKRDKFFGIVQVKGTRNADTSMSIEVTLDNGQVVSKPGYCIAFARFTRTPSRTDIWFGVEVGQTRTYNAPVPREIQIYF